MGLHESTIDEIREKLGFSERRVELIDGLERYLNQWAESALVDFLVIDGSFVTSKPEPGDIDILLAPVPSALSKPSSRSFLYLLRGDRRLTKALFGCDVLVTDERGSTSYEEMLDFFGQDRNGKVRGLVSLTMVS